MYVVVCSWWSTTTGHGDSDCADRDSGWRRRQRAIPDDVFELQSVGHHRGQLRDWRTYLAYLRHTLLRWVSAYVSRRANLKSNIQGDHLSGKPGNVREFDSCQGNVRDFTKSQGNVTEKILSAKSCRKLFIVSCIFVSIQVF